MKLKILYIGLAACTSMLSAQPKLALDKNDIDLGIFYSGEVRRGTIRISNIGTDTLKIFSVHPTCGCTTVKQPKEYLLPNQSDEIVVEYNSNGSSGSVHKRVIISTNDPSSPSVDVNLHGEARVDMEQTDPNTWFGEIYTDSTFSSTLVFRNKSGTSLTVKTVTSSSPDIHIQWEKATLKPDETISIKIDFKPKAKYNAETFWLETDSKHQPRIESRISYFGKSR